MKRMLVLGATSEIAEATLFEFAKSEPWHMILCGRDLSSLQLLSKRLVELGCVCEVKRFDTAMDDKEQLALFNECLGIDANEDEEEAVPEIVTYVSSSSGRVKLGKDDYPEDSADVSLITSKYMYRVKGGAVEDEAQDETAGQNDEADSGNGLDVVFCAVGYLGDQKKAEADPAEAELIMRSNFNGLVPMLTYAGKYFKRQRNGSILVVSSVAGERGRCSNYLYGASKAAMTAFLSGMRCSLLTFNVHVMTIKPGYVATRMVAHKKLPPYITASTQTVAADIVRGYNEEYSVVYTMWLWRYIMAVVRLIPEFIFKRLNMF